MRSDESFIEDVLKKEKIRRAEKRAAKRRAVGICSSLALLFVIVLAAPTVTNMFSAHKSFDAALESEGNTASDMLADVEDGMNYGTVIEVPEADGELNKGEISEDVNDDVNSDKESNKVPAQSDDAYLDYNVGAVEKDEEGESSRNDASCGDNSSDGVNDTAKDEAKPAEKTDWLAVALIILFAAAAAVAVSVIVKRRTNSNNI